VLSLPASIARPPPVTRAGALTRMAAGAGGLRLRGGGLFSCFGCCGGGEDSRVAVLFLPAWRCPCSVPARAGVRLCRARRGERVCVQAHSSRESEAYSRGALNFLLAAERARACHAGADCATGKGREAT